MGIINEKGCNMQILLYNNENSHHKNTNALNNYKNIQFKHISSLDEISDYDCVISACNPIDVSKYPKTLFIFGPQFSVFPDEKLNHIKSDNSYFNLLSQWVVNIWNLYDISRGMNFITLPHGVETEKFTEKYHINEREKVFIYFKHRQHSELSILMQFLNNKNISYKIFSYDHRYDEAEFLRYLQESKYGIILDAHESQGFAIQEALSCNVPLLVWNVSLFSQEVGTNYPDFPATSVPYWDERCGELFYNIEEIEDKFQLFTTKLTTYNPRQYILENLSMEVCEKRLIDFINEKKIEKI